MAAPMFDQSLESAALLTRMLCMGLTVRKRQHSGGIIVSQSLKVHACFVSDSQRPIRCKASGRRNSMYVNSDLQTPQTRDHLFVRNELLSSTTHRTPPVSERFSYHRSKVGYM